MQRKNKKWVKDGMARLQSKFLNLQAKVNQTWMTDRQTKMMDILSP